MKEWQRVELRSIAKSIQYGYTESASNKPIGPKFLRITDIVHHRIDWASVPYCSINENDFRKYRLSKGDIVVARTGNTTGWAKLIREDKNAVFASYLIRFTIDQELASPDYVGRLLESDFFKDYVWSVIGGAAQPGANASLLSGFKFLLPPLVIQKKIAEILSAYDDLIENNLKRIKLFEEFTRITYDEWFVHFKVNHKNLPVNSTTGLPDGWKRKRLGDLTTLLSRGVAPKYVESDGLLVLNQKCIRDGAISMGPSRLTSLQTNIPPEKYLQLYDVLINSTGAGTLGRVAQVISADVKMTVDTHISIVRANKDIISPILLGLAIRNQENLLSSMGKGSTNQLELSRSDLKDLVEVIVPCPEIQKRFDLLIEPVSRQIANLRKQNILLMEARQILLPRLMTGRIEVKSEQRIIEEITIHNGNVRETSWENKEAVLIAMLTDKFGNTKIPIGRTRYTKLSYFFHRKVKGDLKRYSRLAGGMYNPATKYDGPEEIALQKRYIQTQEASYRGVDYVGFIAGENIEDAREQFLNNWTLEQLGWLEKFNGVPTDMMGLYTTVDDAMLELYKNGKKASVTAIKKILKDEKELKQKLEQPLFNDLNIQKAIDYLLKTFSYP